MEIPNIMQYALSNAAVHDGKADKTAVLGRVLKEHPEMKKQIKDVIAEIDKVIAKVNSLSIDEQTAQLGDKAPELLQKQKPAKRELIELPDAQLGNVVTRLPPEPSKHLHIGHALSFTINYMYAQKYEGKCILRYEDTNPATAKKEFIDSMDEEIKHYLQIKPSETRIVSSDMQKFYDHAEQLIKIEKAYVCDCTKEQISEMRQKGELCECRTRTSEEHMADWNEMLKGKFDEGQKVLRLVGDIQSPNMVMRDPSIFRISKEIHHLHKHKYSVWPLYDFENAVEDATTGVTHILRSIEFGEMRVELQDYIKKLLKLPIQTVVQYGRINISGSNSQGREIREMINSGKYIGWDDPRLVTLTALRKRGIQSETYRELAIEVGLSKTKTNLDFTVVSSINRKILNDKTKRLFLIKEPVLIDIEGAPEQEAEVKNHPTLDLGTRKYKVHSKFYIEKSDAENFEEGEIVRLMDCLNFKVHKGKYAYEHSEYEKFKGKGKKIIHWVPKEHSVEVHVMMPDAKKIKCKAETDVTKLKNEDIIQFTRFGFCRVEDIKGQLFWYGHE